MRLRSFLILLGVILALPGVLFGLPGVFFHLVMPGWTVTQSWDLLIARNFAPAYPFFWFVVVVMAIVVIMFAASSAMEYDSYSRSSSRSGESGIAAITTGCLAGAVLVVGLFQYGNILWNNKDYPRYYNQAASFVVSDIEKPPVSLQRLLEGARVGDSKCLRFGAHDVPSCIRQGEFPAEGWENRSASLAGAVRVMKQASGESQQVDLLAETAAHIYPPRGEAISGADTVSNGYWTAIRDGKNIRIPTEGVVEWDGKGRPTTCEFNGKYELNRALRGGRSNSFQHLLADKFPKLRWNRSDTYGFCDHDNGNQPVIVIPMYRQVRYVNRSVATPAGVLLVRGSSSGEPKFELKHSVKNGEVPGPVYPLSIAETQRGEHTWAAGREYHSRSKFGFEPTTAASQTGNASEFLLRSRKDGRTYWVSPLTPRGSDSQLVLAYTLIPADTVNDGKLNELTIHVFDREDAHVVNLDQMERDFRDFVSRQNPGFFSAKGEIKEFTPASNNTWRAFGVIDGDPRFVVTIDPNGDNRPSITDIRGGTTVKTAAPSGAEPTEITDACALPLTEQTPDQLVSCAQAALDELKRRTATTG